MIKLKSSLMRLAESAVILILLVCFVMPALAQTDEDLKKREKEFKKITKTLAAQGITTGSIGEQLNELFREYVSRGGCGLVDADRIDKALSFVPDEIINQNSVTNVKTRKAEIIKANGIRMFWYVYRTGDKNNTNLAIVPTRFLSAFDSESTRVKVEPSKDFSNWILSRNCTGYLNTKADAKAAFFTLSASAAIQADFKNTASLVLIGGTFTSPISDYVGGGGWKQLLLDLNTWNLYAENNEIVDDAWILKSFDGVMANKEVGISRNFSFNGSLEGNTSIPIGNIAGSLKSGMLDGTTLNFKLYQLLIASDIDDKNLREKRFIKLSTVAQIANEMKSASLVPVKADRPLIQGLPYEHSQLFRGMPKNICESQWKLTDEKKDVFSSLTLSPVYQEIESEDKSTKIPVCEFRITGMPAERIFAANAGIEPTLEAIITNENQRLKVGQNALQLQIQQKFNTSKQPIPIYVGGSAPIPFVAKNEGDGSKFTISWRDIDVKFEDSKEPVKKDKGTVGDVSPVVMNNCGQFRPFPVTGEIAAAEGSVYRMTIRSDLSILSSEYESNSSSDEPCNYQTTISVPLARAGNPTVTRQISLVLRIPKKKVIPPATPAPVVPPSGTPPANPVAAPATPTAPKPTPNPTPFPNR
jgi:hypothetical protein